jgi:hypothetical protein
LNRETLYRHPAMRNLRNAILRELRMQFAMSLLLLAFGSGLCVLTFKFSVVFSIIGLGLSMVGGKLVVDTTTNLRIDNHLLLNYLRYQPQHIVWVYSVITDRVPFGIHLFRTGTLHFKLDDGSDYSVGMQASKLKLVSKFLMRLLPHATFGYTVDREYTFRVSPERLRKAQESEDDRSDYDY